MRGNPKALAACTGESVKDGGDSFGCRFVMVIRQEFCYLNEIPGGGVGNSGYFPRRELSTIQR